MLHPQAAALSFSPMPGLGHPELLYSLYSVGEGCLVLGQDSLHISEDLSLYP